MFKFDLESLARDVAFEIQLGGDRFDPDDLGEMLQGIPKKDLDTFRERVALHAQDFAPKWGGVVRANEGFVQKQLDIWLAHVHIAEELGYKVGDSWYKGMDLSYDKGTYFVFDDCSVKLCEAATARAMWGKEAAARAIRRMNAAEVAEHTFDLLVNPGDTSRFCSNTGFPEGRVESVSRSEDGKERYFNLEDGSRMSLSEAIGKYPSFILNVLDYEADERLYREISEAMLKRQDVADFRMMAAELIDRDGRRVMRDFLYDEAVVKSNDTGTITVSRAVDDLRDSRELDISVRVETGASKKIIAVNEAMDAGVLSSITKAVSERLDALRSESGLFMAGERVDFLDGPVINIYDEASDGRCFCKMKVDSLQSGEDGKAMAVGRYLDGEGKVTGQVSVPVWSLSDKSVKKLREASDGVVNLLGNGRSSTLEGTKQQKGKKSKKGIDF